MFVEYDDNAFPYPQTIGRTAPSINGLGPADENMIDTIFIMPNKSTNPDATLMIVVDEVDPSTDPKTYQYVYVGNINNLPSDVLTEGSIINDLTTGGTDKPLSAEQGRTLNSHVNYTTCESGAADQVKLISDDGFELSTHLRLLVKMNNINTNSIPKFNINNTGVKDVWYNGSVASDTNTWSSGEVLDVYYDGSKYVANTHGGAQFSTGEKVGDVGIDSEPTAGSDNLVKSGGVFDNVKIIDNKLFEVNLLNETAIYQNTSLIRSNGNTQSDNNYATTGFIKVTEGLEYYTTAEARNYEAGICYYDENKGFVSSFDGVSSGTTTPQRFTVPSGSNIHYVRLCKVYYTTNELIAYLPPTNTDSTPIEESKNFVNSGNTYTFIDFFIKKSQASNIDLSNLTEYTGIISPYQQWLSSGGKCKFLPVRPNETYLIEAINYTTEVVPLTQVGVGSGTPAFATGYDNRVEILKGNYIFITIPSDAVCLYIRTDDGIGDDITPSVSKKLDKILTYGQQTLNSNEKTQARNNISALSSEYSIDLSVYTPNTGIIIYSAWVSHSGTSIVIPIIGGKSYLLKSKESVGCDYAFLTQTTWGPSGTSAQFATGYTDRVTLAADKEVLLQAPSNAKTLYIRTSSSGGDMTPTISEIVTLDEYLKITPVTLSETQKQNARNNIDAVSNNQVLSKDLTESIVVTQATLIRSNGTYVSTTSTGFGAIKEFIPVLPGQKFLTNAYNKNYDAGICYYSSPSESSFISAIDGCTSASMAEIFTVPDNVYYLRISSAYYSTYGLKLVIYGTSVDNFPKEKSYNLITSDGVFNLFNQHLGIESNRKIVCLGDSITQGDNIGNNVGMSYPQRMKEIMEADVYNAGLGGATYTTATTYGFTTMVDAIVSGDWTTIDSVVDDRSQQSAYSYLRDRFDEIEALDFSKVDIITIAFGTNDFAQNQVLDNQNNPIDKTTILGALRYGLDALLTAYPQLRIYVFTPSFRFNLSGSESNNTDNTPNNNGLYTIDICNSIEEVCESFHIPCKNLYKDSCFNKYTWPILTPTVSGGGKDGTHPNDLGAYRLAILCAKFISTK